MKKTLLALAALFFAFRAEAAPQHLVIDHTNSTLTFTANVNGSPSKGSFKTFDADIAFDPKALNESYANVTVELKSVESAYEEVAKQLKTIPWFNIDQFPQATFKSTKFLAKGGNDYIAEGTLTLKGVALPVSAAFTLVRFDDQGAEIKGSSMVKRLMFGIGQGEWQDTSAVKNEVLVEFHVTAKKK
ncbi:MAG: YceI family protein [Rickettsiales bacterium]